MFDNLLRCQLWQGIVWHPPMEFSPVEWLQLALPQKCIKQDCGTSRTESVFTGWSHKLRANQSVDVNGPIKSVIRRLFRSSTIHQVTRYYEIVNSRSLQVLSQCSLDHPGATENQGSLI